MSKKPQSSPSAGAKNNWTVKSIRALLEDLIHGWEEGYHIKIKRLDTPNKRGINVQFYCEGGWQTAPPEKYMEEVASWCAETNCGKRTSFDMFQFKTEQEYMMFMLRWQ